jgi:hypothetical protein
MNKFIIAAVISLTGLAGYAQKQFQTQYLPLKKK